MSISIIPSRVGLSVPPPVAARWFGLTWLLIAEVLALSLRFEAPRFPLGSPWWAYPLAHSHEFLVPALLAAGTVALLGGFRSLIARPSGPSAPANQLGKLIAAHLVAVALFATLTARVFEGDTFATSTAAAWVVAWYGAGTAVVATWLVALHPNGWRGLLGRRELAAVAVGVAVGAGALASGRLSSQLWLPMAHATLMLVRGLLGLVATNITGDPADCRIGVDQFTVRIAPACSGYEGIGLVLIFLAVYLLGARRSLRWPAAWWLVPLGTLAIWLVNAVRIAALVLIGAWGSPAVAVGGFHSQAGSLGILAISLGLVLLSRQAARSSGRPPPGRADRTSRTGADGSRRPTRRRPTSCPVPGRSWPTTMATGAFSAGPGLDALVSAPDRRRAGAALWAFRPDLPGAVGGLVLVRPSAVGAPGVRPLGGAGAGQPRGGGEPLEAGWDARLPAAWAWTSGSPVPGRWGRRWSSPLAEELGVPRLPDAPAGRRATSSPCRRGGSPGSSFLDLVGGLRRCSMGAGSPGCWRAWPMRGPVTAAGGSAMRPSPTR